jgi:hypothetical protein
MPTFPRLDPSERCAAVSPGPQFSLHSPQKHWPTAEGTLANCAGENELLPVAVFNALAAEPFASSVDAAQT